MKIIFNFSSVQVGGALQVANSFISDYTLILTPSFDSMFLISQALRSQLSPEVLTNIDYKLIEDRGFFSKTFSKCAALDSIESDFMPDVVFTLFGPAYWRPKYGKHIIGFALPWMVYTDLPAFVNLPFRNKLIKKLLNKFRRSTLKNEGHYFICETDDVSEKLANLLSINRANVVTVPNAISPWFKDFTPRVNKGIGKRGRILGLLQYLITILIKI